MKRADVLIVDDDVALSDALSDVLEANGYHAVVAQGGPEAIEQAKRMPFDLALLDIRMPEMNGVATYKKLKEIRPEMQAIMMTAYSLEALLEEALREGVLEVLPKPLDIDQLLALIQSVAGEGTAEEVPDAPGEPWPPALEQPAKASILVIEDYDWQRESLGDILGLQAGYDVETAATGWEALTKAEQRLFNIAIIDLKLPDIQGVELLHRLKQVHPTIEGIILTGHASLESAARAVREAAFAYLLKPLHPDELIATIEEALAKQHLALEREQELIQQRQEAERHRFLAMRDPLTRLYNRRYFDESLNREIARVQRYGQLLSLLMIDIDGFKDCNDTYGHLAGDEALKQVAQLMRQGCREVDIVARFGGDEFAVLLPETSGSQAVHAARRLRMAIETLGWGQHMTPPHPGLTICVGVAQYEVGTSAEELIQRADQALYAAKGQRNSVFFWDAEKRLPVPGEPP